MRRKKKEGGFKEKNGVMKSGGAENGKKRACSSCWGGRTSTVGKEGAGDEQLSPRCRGKGEKEGVVGGGENRFLRKKEIHDVTRLGGSLAGGKGVPRRRGRAGHGPTCARRREGR